MHKVGDLIIYGNTGVCRITEITQKMKNRLYYTLQPLYQGCVIYTPVDNTKVYMRPIISADEANQLIDMIPSLKAEPYYNNMQSQLDEHYGDVIKTHNCQDLIELTMSIYAKKQYAEQQKRKFGIIDEKYRKRAEELLFGELGAALNIPKEQVSEYIETRLHKTQNKA